MITSPDPSAPLRLVATAAVVLVLACSGSDGSDQGADTVRASGGTPGTSESTTSHADQARLPDSQLGDLEREELTLSLPWTRGQINRDAPEDEARASLRSVSFSEAENVDRMTLTFDSAGSYPGYTVDASMSPLPRCASADSVPVEGQGLLRVRIRNVAADESASGSPTRQPDLENVTTVHRTCLEEEEVEWILDVRRATYYRVVQASNPPRVMVDVMQTIEEDPQEETER